MAYENESGGSARRFAADFAASPVSVVQPPVLIIGPPHIPQPDPAASSNGVMIVVAVIVCVALAGGLGFFIYKMLTRKPQPVQTATVPGLVGMPKKRKRTKPKQDQKSAVVPPAANPDEQRSSEAAKPRVTVSKSKPGAKKATAAQSPKRTGSKKTSSINTAVVSTFVDDINRRQDEILSDHFAAYDWRSEKKSAATQMTGSQVFSKIATALNFSKVRPPAVLYVNSATPKKSEGRPSATEAPEEPNSDVALSSVMMPFPLDIPDGYLFLPMDYDSSDETPELHTGRRNPAPADQPSVSSQSVIAPKSPPSPDVPRLNLASLSTPERAPTPVAAAPAESGDTPPSSAIVPLDPVTPISVASVEPTSSQNIAADAPETPTFAEESSEDVTESAEPIPVELPTCIRCASAPADAAFLPCGHGEMCLACARNFVRRPMPRCRTCGAVIVSIQPFV